VQADGWPAPFQSRQTVSLSQFGDTVIVKHGPPQEPARYVLLETQSGALVIRYLEKMTAHTLTVTKQSGQKTTVKRSGVKSIYRVIDIEEALH
jgi:hypothetical protein